MPKCICTCMVSGGRDFKRQLGLDEIVKLEPGWWNIVLVRREKTRAPSPLSVLCHMRTQHKDGHLQSRKHILNRLQVCQPLDLKASQLPELWEITVCCGNQLTYGTFVVVAQIDWDICKCRIGFYFSFISLLSPFHSLCPITLSCSVPIKGQDLFYFVIFNMFSP